MSEFKVELLLKYINIFENENLHTKIYMKFIKDVYESGLVYHFDWPRWEEDAKKYFNNPDLLNNANLEIIRKLLTLHIRKDRFCDYHLEDMIRSGHISQILKRLREIENEVRLKK